MTLQENAVTVERVPCYHRIAQSFLTRVYISAPRYHANIVLIKSCGHKGISALQKKKTLPKFRMLRDFSLGHRLRT